MSARQNALNEWLGQVLNQSPYTITAIPGDASFRHYFRLQCQNTSYIVMDAPPEHFNIAPFLNIATLLKQHHVYTPEVFASNHVQGFALLEDLGDTLLYSQANAAHANVYYLHALDTLVTLQQCTTKKPPLARFDSAVMYQEMQLFRTWFLEAWLGLHLTATEKNCIDHAMQQLSKHLLEQPQCFIHRDYHSRNLLVINTHPEPRIGVIDFQDAMQGPWSYDLVSLTKDCYLNWSEEQQTAWVNYFYQQLPQRFGWSMAEFQYGVDWCGLQRHLKVLGIFCRLHLRDKKSAYLRDLPLTLQHTLCCLARYPAFHPLYEFMQQRVVDSFQEKQPA